MRDLDGALEVHRRIEALYPVIEQCEARLRGLQKVGPGIPLPHGTSSGVAADRVVCALAIKAATTKRAIATLCDLGDGDSAAALSRVIIENAVLLRWLLGGPGRQRLETYILFTSVLHEQGASVVRRILAQRPDLDDGPDRGASRPYHRAVSESVFDDHTHTATYIPDPKQPGKLKPVSVRQMFEEVTDARDPIDYHLLYKGFGTHAVHSNPFSLSHIVTALRERQTFTVQPIHARDLVGFALESSNIAMVAALSALNEYAYLNIGEDLAAISDWMRRKDRVPGGDRGDE